MKKYILYIFAFFAVVAVVDLVVGKAADYMVDNARGGAMKQLYDLCEKDHYDMLVMGSSKARHNYIPQVFRDSLGVTCYNAGYDGEGIILAYGILSLIDEDRVPELIVYDSKLQFDLYEIDQDGDHSRYYSKLRPFLGRPEVDNLVRDISQTDYLKLHSGLYRTNGKLLSIVSGFIRDSQEDSVLGYEPAIGYLKDSREAERDYSKTIDEVKIGYFDKFLKLAKEKKVKLVVVFSPEFNSPYSADYQPIRDMCSAAGVPVLDYFEDSAFQDITIFADHCHMNEDGARLFSSRIVRDLLTERQNLTR